MSYRIPRCSLLLFVLLSSVLACNSDEAFNPIGSTYFDTPRVGGLWVYDANGAYIGAWGEPHLSDYYGTVASMPSNQQLRAYPNPACKPMPNTVFSFSVPRPSRVWIWTVRALGPSDMEAALEQAAGGEYVRPGGGPVAILMNGDRLPNSGLYQVVWTLEANPAAYGFYRVMFYSKTDQGETFRSFFDMLYWWGGDCELAPADLRPYLRCSHQ